MNNADTITLTRAEYDSLIERLEDAEDARTIEAFNARVAAVGFAEATKDYLPADLVWRLLDGEHPLRIWREHRNLTGNRLAELSGVPQSYISDIETVKKPGSIAALTKLARALEIQIDDLVPVSL